MSMAARAATSPFQPSLFDELPPGLRLRADFISPVEEANLVDHFAELAFKPFSFQGWAGKRETISFGWRYDFDEARMHEAPPIPAFLMPLRQRAASFADLPAEALEQALIVRYDAGAGIGWHRDRPVFDRVVGVSLLAPCVLRLRRREGKGFSRCNLPLAPRSAYLLSGPVRYEWEHSIVPMETRRFSVTFRSRGGE
jgi:alkylated DNA repair dioxygenase AlkB